jgi:hypothetical protein
LPRKKTPAGVSVVRSPTDPASFNDYIFQLLFFKANSNNFHVTKEADANVHAFLQHLKKVYKAYASDSATSVLTQDQVKISDSSTYPCRVVETIIGVTFSNSCNSTENVTDSSWCRDSVKFPVSGLGDGSTTPVIQGVASGTNESKLQALGLPDKFGIVPSGNIGTKSCWNTRRNIKTVKSRDITRIIEPWQMGCQTEENGSQTEGTVQVSEKGKAFLFDAVPPSGKVKQL